MVKECKDTCSSAGKEGEKVASAKEPPSWIKHKIYNTRSKMLADRDQVSSGGLVTDKVPKVTLGRKSHIAIKKSQVKVDVKNGK